MITTHSEEHSAGDLAKHQEEDDSIHSVQNHVLQIRRSAFVQQLIGSHEFRRTEEVLSTLMCRQKLPLSQQSRQR